MCRLYRAIAFVVFAAFTGSCGYNSAASETPPQDPGIRPAPASGPGGKTGWKQIDLPVYGGKIDSYENELYIVSSEGVVVVNSTGEVRKLPDFKIVKATLSTDGGLTGKPLSQTDSKLCSDVQSSAFASSSLFVYSVCEHTAQIWKISFTAAGTSLEMIHLTYAYDGDWVPGPRGVVGGENGVLMESYMAAGPTLMTGDPKTGRLKVVWQGPEKNEGIAAIDLKGADGWMVTGSGKLLKSSDGGRGWQERGRVPEEFNDQVTRLKIKNDHQAFIAGNDGLILFTNDGGMTWQRENTGENTSIDYMDLNENIAVAAGSSSVRSSGSFLLVRKADSDKWTKAESPGEDINDIYLAVDRLYVLADGKLYYKDIAAL